MKFHVFALAFRVAAVSAEDPPAETSSSGGLPTWAWVLIVISVVAAIILFIYLYRKCRKHNIRQRDKWIESEQMKADMAKTEREDLSMERKAERNDIYDKMRSKYGLAESSQSLGNQYAV